MRVKDNMVEERKVNVKKGLDYLDAPSTVRHITGWVGDPPSDYLTLGLGVQRAKALQ